MTCTINLPPLHPKQQEVFDSKATEILYAGDTRSGKSYTVRHIAIAACVLIPGLIVDHFRLFFDDVIQENMVGETSYPILLDSGVKSGDITINQTEVKFWNGSIISLYHCSDDTVLLKHRGNPSHLRIFGESTQILEHRIRALTGWVTMSEEMLSRVPPVWRGTFPRIYHVTNPHGVSRGFYRRNFVDCRKPYAMQKVGAFTRQYIPAFIDDNPSENKETVIARMKEAYQDVEVQKAFINEEQDGISNWHSGAGEFFPEFNIVRHVVTSFTPPHHWFRYRAFDWGTHEPACCLWIAVSDGEVFRDDLGRERWFPKGARIFYREWYICNAQRPAEGLRMRNSEMARGILQRSESDFLHVPTLADSKPFQDTGGDNPALEFARAGCALTQCPTPPGSRIPGWSLVRDALIGKWFNGFTEKLPLVYFCECCEYTIDYIPALPRHPSEHKKEDAAESGEATHCADTVRLALMAHTIVRELEGPTEQQIKEVTRKLSKRPTMKSLTGISFNGS